MKTLIKNGTIITEKNEFVGDILIEDEKILLALASMLPFLISGSE